MEVIVTTNESPKKMPRLPPEAQAAELQVRFLAAQERHRFDPGDLVMRKPGLGQWKRSDVGIFWRALNYDAVPLDARLIDDFVEGNFSSEPDCLVGLLIPPDGILALVVDESWRLIPYLPPSARLAS